ncbi:hypothetical protein IB238_08170 [Rhizobium sp. ARZ01]|uniref:hypothetical protein n=1 Tax=Rhizobium sp. ARZ01 TaxID=2769313 RepID=UPI00177F3049|nr:hypothetical protein [Rhizobium sp. ARZ01]MBD9372595.1 hypothetical protein [Rhizobium sp. ARZ01]
MQFRKYLSAATLALAVGFGLPSTAISQTTHDGHGATAVELTLNNGAKWQGDDNMIKGMNAIRDVMASQMTAIHDNTLSSDVSATMAKDIETQIDFMVANCKLTPEVDEQFHMVLAQLLDGIAKLHSGAEARNGAIQIVETLKVYGDHFEHPHWQALE